MDKYWTRLVIVGFVLVFVVVSWDFFLTLAGYKSDFQTIVIPISPTLYGQTETFLRADPNFDQYQAQADAQQQQSAN